MKLSSLPFHIGTTEQPHNPAGLPDCLPFEVVFDERWGGLAQPRNPDLEAVLARAYALGQAFGTPLAADDFGKPYANDFLSLIQASGARQGRGLEIGAGVGYLTRRLIDEGWRMDSLEPGRGYEPFWAKYGVDVIDDYFPSERAPGPYEMICAYGVLEHVPDPLAFLEHLKAHLTPGGRAYLSVPDCTDEIQAADPSILFHEHLNYFDAGSLLRLLQRAGLQGRVKKSGFGRCLYAEASAKAGLQSGEPGETGLPQEVVASYPERCSDSTTRIRVRLGSLANKAPLGIYCAARGLAMLDPQWRLRFFDDDPLQRGKYLPPFLAPIEERSRLFADPPQVVAILSRTFGERIRDSLRADGFTGVILTIQGLASE